MMTGLARETAGLQKLSMMHVYGDPLKYRDLESKIAVEKFNSAIILCDAAWVDPDQVSHVSSLCVLDCAIMVVGDTGRKGSDAHNERVLHHAAARRKMKKIGKQPFPDDYLHLHGYCKQVLLVQGCDLTLC